MKIHIKSRHTALAWVLLSSVLSTNLQADDSLFCSVAPTIIPRSQGRDNARRSVGLMGHIYLCDQPDWYGNLAITGEYTRTFRSNKLINCLFGADVISTTSNITATGCELESCNTKCIRIQGSQVANRQANAWLADYFYLPTDFESTVCFNPKIQNVIVDFDYYQGLDPFVCGMYFRLYGPLTWSKWDLGFCEVVSNRGTNSYPAGYFNAQGIQRADLLTSFESYAIGNAPGIIPPINSSLSDDVNGFVCLEPLHYARMSRCSESRFGFADLRAELGWDAFCGDCYTGGFGLLVAAPTGTNKQASLLFEPVIGNGHHWEFGFDVHWLHKLWCCEERDLAVNLFIDANVTHLFGTYQRRTFDLCNKPMSRYMLAQKMTPLIVRNLTAVVNDGVSSELIQPAAQFDDIYMPVANLTTLNIKTSISAESEILVMFNVTKCNWDLDFGYNFWIRACEKFECPDACKQNICTTLCDTNQSWALKGDARVFGFTPADLSVPLSATESGATIHTGTNALSTQANALNQNFGIDSPRPAQAFGLGLTFEPTAVEQISTSLIPQLLSCPQDINFQRTRSLSHKVFGNLSYNWCDNECWMPFLGVGGFAEFGKVDKCNPVNTTNVSCTLFDGSSCTSDCSPCKNSCIDCSVSQWGVWIKGGVSF